MALSLLDSNQVTQDVHDVTNHALRISGTGAGGKVDITASSPVPVTLAGSSNLDILSTYNIASGSLTTSYHTVEASALFDYSKIAVYETTGETIELAVDSVVKMTIGPGCDQAVEIQIPSGSLLQVRTVGSNASSGSLILNLLGAV